MSSINIRGEAVSKRRQEAIVSSERKKLVLGREVHQKVNGVNIGKIVYYQPSPYSTQYENTLLYGPSGSGKTYVGYGLASQSYFSEARTWIIFDTKLSYIGNERPNVDFLEDIYNMKLVPRGIPPEQIDIIAPTFYIRSSTIDELDATKITDAYKIPLRLCTPKILFELTKMNKGASYASTFDMAFKEILLQTHKNPRLKDVYDYIDNDIIANDDYPNVLKWTFKMLKQKIQEVSDFAIDENNSMSAIGKALRRAAIEQKPRWIVFTLAHSQTPQDDANLALFTAVIDEIKEFSQEVRINNYDVRLGIILDELHTFVRKKDATSTEAIHDLIFAWGRTSKIWRMYMTQKKEQLPKTFQDDIENLDKTGVYQNIIKCQAIPEPGYGSLLDRLNTASSAMVMGDEPRFVPHIKFCPPIIEVESDISDNHDWYNNIIKKNAGPVKRTTKTPEQMAKSWEELLLGTVKVADLHDILSTSAVGEHMKVMPNQNQGTVPVMMPSTKMPEIKKLWMDVENVLMDDRD